MAGTAWAAPILDGTRDAGYSLRSVQTVETQFGDNHSELDAAWARIDGGVLYLVLTGNLEDNFNNLNVFIDSTAGGENQLTPAADSGGFNPANENWANKYAGFRFDTGFEADYLIILRNGTSGGPRFDIDYAVIGGGAEAFETATDVFGGSLTGSNADALPVAGIGVAFDNSNVAGVSGGTAAADQAAAAAVTTGIELAIPLSALGNPNPQDIKISAHVNGSNHDFLSNQFLGGLTPPQVNLGGDGAGGFTGTVGNIDLTNAVYAAGDQFFTLVGLTDDTDPDTIGDAILELPDSAFHSGGNKTAFLNRLESIKQLIIAGDNEQAIIELQSLRRRVDGCGASADKNDWIIDCDAQLEVRELLDTLVANLGG
jgi:hypothetical protein